jgi:peptidoglycan-associated lipoprotein
LVAGIIASAGCGKKTPMVSAPRPAAVEAAPAAPPPPPEAPAPATPPAALSDDELFARKSLAELNAERPLGEVLFRLDEAAIGDEGRAVLQRNAAWLQRWPTTRVTIEGHCDERGTAEYNLSLGERRAQAVRDYLVNVGIDGGRLVTVTKGKESPVCAEQHEACWQRNRRAQSVITAK